MARAIAEHLAWLRLHNYSPRTVRMRDFYLNAFAAWLEERGVTRPTDVTKPMLERYQRHLFHQRKVDGKPLSFSFQHQHLCALRGFFRWAARQNRILYNPASELEPPRRVRRLPRHVLTIGEVEQVLAQPDVTDPLGLRDRAMLETLYSTGMRRSELCGLTLVDLDSERGTVLIRQGKGQRDRMVPIGERAIAWVDRYVAEVRPHLVVEPDPGVLFLASTGEAVGPDWLSRITHRYVDRAALGKQGSCHLLRHTMATSDAGGRGRRPLHPGDARPRPAGDHRGLHPRRHPPAQGGPHRHPSRSHPPPPPECSRPADPAGRVPTGAPRRPGAG